ncbi:hypothetical protein FHH43_14605 [Clostridium perfringens]|nr:hypothetical protein [Clostridium perfringens]
MYNDFEVQKKAHFKLRDTLKDTIKELETKREDLILNFNILLAKEELFRKVNAPEEKENENKNELELKRNELRKVEDDLLFNMKLIEVLDAKLNVRYMR